MNNRTQRATAAYDPSRRSGVDATLAKAKSFIGNDGANLMDLHSVPLENSIQAVPAKLKERHQFGEHGLDELMKPEIIDKAQDWTEKITDFFKMTGDSAGKVFSQVGDITNVGLNKTAGNPMLVTVGAAAIGVVAGLKAVKNIIHGIKIALDPKGDPKLGWLPHELLGILQGGLFFGLTSSFFGKRNFLTEFQDGKPVVKIKSLVGVGAASLALSIAMSLAKGTSVLHKIPLIGPALQQISEAIFGAATELTVPTDKNANAEHGAGAPAMPG